MKKMIFALLAMLTTTLAASAMSYEQARNEALFLTDKMAYELNLTDAQYEAAYEINLDYLMGVTSYDDVYGPYWERRNLDMSYILYQWQWDAFRAATYFFRPLYWDAGRWHFGIYARYTVRDYFYFGRPHFYATYRGGHAWHLNNGRSYYYGRSSHFRPTLPSGRQHFGMRSAWDRGDFRGNHHNYRNGSSTRITAGRNNRSTFGNGNDGSRIHSDFGNNNRMHSDFGRGNSNRRNNNSNRQFGNGSNRQFDNDGYMTTPRSSNRQSTTSPSASMTTRHFGDSRQTTTTSRSTTMTPRSMTTTTTRQTTTTAPVRSFGGSRSNAAPTRSYNSGSSSSRSSSSNSHGHFGGRR
jgi:hypothetical protein